MAEIGFGTLSDAAWFQTQALDSLVLSGERRRRSTLPLLGRLPAASVIRPHESGGAHQNSLSPRLFLDRALPVHHSRLEIDVHHAQVKWGLGSLRCGSSDTVVTAGFPGAVLHPTQANCPSTHSRHRTAQSAQSFRSPFPALTRLGPRAIGGCHKRAGHSKVARRHA